MGVLDTIEGTTAATHTVTICLDAGLKGQWDQKAATLEEAARKDAQFGSLAMEHTTAVVEEMDSLRDRMSASEVTFEFSVERLPWDKRLALQAKHPPREGNMLDQAKGFNVETFSPELVKATCIAVSDAKGDRSEKIPAKTWAKMFSRLNLGQFNDLYSAAAATHESPVVPTSARFLLMSQDSEASSTRPGPGTSPPSGSAAGSRRTSRRTSTAKKAAPMKAGSSAR